MKRVHQRKLVCNIFLSFIWFRLVMWCSRDDFNRYFWFLGVLCVLSLQSYSLLFLPPPTPLCFTPPHALHVCDSHLSNVPICRRSTPWLPTWTWKSAASLCCPETERRTAAWMSCRPIAHWPSWLRQKGRATITSTLLSPTASIGRLHLSSALTLCRAPRLTFGGLSSTTAAQPWSCSTSSTSQTLPGYGQSVIYCFIDIDFVDTMKEKRRRKMYE